MTHVCDWIIKQYSLTNYKQKEPFNHFLSLLTIISETTISSYLSLSISNIYQVIVVRHGSLWRMTF